MEADVQIDDQANFVRIALCFGITVASLAQTLGHVSGNPGITVASLAQALGHVSGNPGITEASLAQTLDNMSGN